MNNERKKTTWFRKIFGSIIYLALFLIQLLLVRFYYLATSQDNLIILIFISGVLSITFFRALVKLLLKKIKKKVKKVKIKNIPAATMWEPEYKLKHHSKNGGFYYLNKIKK